MAAVVRADDGQELDVGSVCFHDVKLFLLGSALEDDLILHVVTLYHFNDLRRVVAELVDVDVAASLEVFQNLVQGVQPDLGCVAVEVAQSQLADFSGVHVADVDILVELALFHAGMEDVQLVVRGLGHVDLDHVRAFGQCEFVGDDVVAGDVAAPQTAVRAEDNPFGCGFSDVEFHDDVPLSLGFLCVWF